MKYLFIALFFSAIIGFSSCNFIEEVKPCCDEDECCDKYGDDDCDDEDDYDDDERQPVNF